LRIFPEIVASTFVSRVVDVHPEHRARERFDDLAFDLDFFFFLGHLPHRNRARRARLKTEKHGFRRGRQW